MSDLLADLTAAEDANNKNPEKRCPCCLLLEQVNAEEKEVLIRAFRGTIGGQTLHKVLAKNGFQVSERQIWKHRRESETAQ